MSLPADIIHSNKRLRELAHHLSGYLNALERLLPPGEQARQAFINARATVGFIHAECTQLEMYVGHEQRHGALPRKVEPKDLELHPVRLEQVPVEKLLASLHRVADHTQDPTPTEEGRE